MSIFLIQAGALRRAAMQAGAVTERRSTIPVLAHLHLVAQADAMVVTGNNLEQRVRVDVTGAGDMAPTTVDARNLIALLANIAPEETLTLTRGKADQVVITATGMTARLYTLPAEDFPMTPPVATRAAPVVFTMPAGQLREILSRPRHAISTEGTHYYLNGIYLHLAQQDGAARLTAVATDGHRMFVANTAVPEGAESMPGVIIPRDTLSVLVPHLASLPPETAVTLEVSHTSLAVAGRTWRLDSKVIDGTFPEYPRVIPAAGGARLVVDRPAAFMRQISTVTALAHDRSKPVKMSNGTGNNLTLSNVTAQDGDCLMTVPTEIARWATNGEHPEIGLQARYLKDVCAAFPDGFTAFITDGNAPVRLEGSTGLGVLMPMRV